MNSILSCLVLLPLLWLHLNLCAIASASDPVNSDDDRYNNPSKTFRDEWPRLQTAVDRVIGQIEGCWQLNQQNPVVYKEINGKVRDAIISLIDQEPAMLKDTASYYSRKASNWILEHSCPDYMLRVEECLKREKERVAHYLHSSSEPKLLEKVQHELLSVYPRC
ncbi:hypothetical protein K1719_005821 [Acacia pycnantha]|nr:hypothetical protein K1719_005821 [Acacia pycnantha]